MKKILIISSLLVGLVQVANASDNQGFYTGINLGMASSQQMPDLSSSSGVSPSSNGAGSIFAGYIANPS